MTGRSAVCRSRRLLHLGVLPALDRVVAVARLAAAALSLVGVVGGRAASRAARGR